MMILYHNPKCSKSRNALKYLQKNDYEFEVVDYQKLPLDKTQLRRLLVQLNLPAIDLIRPSEAKDISINDNSSDDKILEAIEANPKAMTRPIVACEDRAVIARDIEKLTEFLTYS